MISRTCRLGYLTATYRQTAHEMFRASISRSRRRLRLLRQSPLRGVCKARKFEANGLFERVRNRAGKGRQRIVSVGSEKFAKSQGQRALLLPFRRIVGGRGCGRLVHAPFPFSDLFYCRMRHRAHRFGRLVQLFGPKTPAVKLCGGNSLLRASAFCVQLFLSGLLVEWGRSSVGRASRSQ